jgi:hypothetical protein
MTSPAMKRWKKHLESAHVDAKICKDMQRRHQMLLAFAL